MSTTILLRIYWTAILFCLSFCIVHKNLTFSIFHSIIKIMFLDTYVAIIIISRLLLKCHRLLLQALVGLWDFCHILTIVVFCFFVNNTYGLLDVFGTCRNSLMASITFNLLVYLYKIMCVPKWFYYIRILCGHIWVWMSREETFEPWQYKCILDYEIKCTVLQSAVLDSDRSE